MRVIVRPVFWDAARSLSMRSGRSLNVTCFLTFGAALRGMPCMYTYVHDPINIYFARVCTRPHDDPVNAEKNNRKERFNMRMDSALMARLHEASNASGMSSTEIVERCLGEHLEGIAAAHAEARRKAAARLLRKSKPSPTPDAPSAPISPLKAAVKRIVDQSKRRRASGEQ